jgi:hypothetical protein
MDKKKIYNYINNLYSEHVGPHYEYGDDIIIRVPNLDAARKIAIDIKQNTESGAIVIVNSESTPTLIIITPICEMDSEL